MTDTPDIVEGADHWLTDYEPDEASQSHPAYLIRSLMAEIARLRAAQSPQAREPDIAKGLSDCGVGAPYGDGSTGEKAALGAYTVLRCCNLIGAGDWRVPERIGNCTEAMVTKPLGAPPPQARDEGGAVEGPSEREWVDALWRAASIVSGYALSDRSPADFVEVVNADLIALNKAAHGPLPTDEARDEGGAEAKAREIDPEAFASAVGIIYRSRSARRERARARAEHLLAAINTAEGEAWLAQKEPAGRLEQPAATSGQSDTTPQGEAGAAVASPPQAPQDVAEVLARVSEFALMVELFGEWNADSTDRRMVYQSRELWASDLRRLAAALTPRELTDEEAERGARAICADRGIGYVDASWSGREHRAARAVYRAITEKPQ